MNIPWVFVDQTTGRLFATMLSGEDIPEKDNASDYFTGQAGQMYPSPCIVQFLTPQMNFLGGVSFVREPVTSPNLIEVERSDLGFLLQEHFDMSQLVSDGANFTMCRVVSPNTLDSFIALIERHILATSVAELPSAKRAPPKRHI